MDMKFVFLNGELKETVYVRQSLGITTLTRYCAYTRHSMGFGKHHEPGT